MKQDKFILDGQTFYTTAKGNHHMISRTGIKMRLSDGAYEAAVTIYERGMANKTTNETKEEKTMTKATIEELWDGDTYSYVVKAGDKRIETTYDYHDAVEIADTYNAAQKDIDTTGNNDEEEITMTNCTERQITNILQTLQHSEVESVTIGKHDWTYNPYMNGGEWEVFATESNHTEYEAFINIDDAVTYAVAQQDIDTAIECGLIEAKKEEITMTQSTFTTKLGNTFSTNDKGNYFYMTDANGKKYRIKKSEYEQAKRAYELECRMDTEAWEAEADAERKAREDKMMADAKATEDAVNGKTRKTEEEIAKLDDAAEDDSVTLQEFCEMLSEDERATIEPAEAELLNNARTEKKAKGEAKKTARKPRKSKDIAYEGHGVTLTAKQVDFIHHLPDTCFWEMGIDSVIWCDVLCDDIKGQFEGKPMTIGAMISTLCEKHLGFRLTQRREGRKCTSFSLTDLGKEVAKELGLE